MDFKDKYISNTVKSCPDKRDHLLTLSGKKIPSCYLIKHDVPIRSQKGIGSCCSHAVVRAVEIQMKKKRNHFVEGSELFHYYMARKNVNNDYPYDKGMSVRDGCKTMQKYGSSLEMLWPYITKRFNTAPSLVSKWCAGLTKAKSYSRVRHLSQLKECISDNVPIVCGVSVDTNFYKLLRSGKNNLWSPGGIVNGGHAVIVIGYDDDEKVLYLENSWGTRFGDKGLFKIDYADFVNVSFDWFALNI